LVVDSADLLGDSVFAKMRASQSSAPVGQPRLEVWTLPRGELDRAYVHVLERADYSPVL